MLCACKLCAGQQQLEATSTSAACPSSTVIHATPPATPLRFTPGRTYKLGPGTYTMAATVGLAAGKTLCIIGSASQPTIVLPPRTTAGTPKASKLHFTLQGGRLLLINVTLSGHLQGPQLGGGGVVIMGSNSSGSNSSGSNSSGSPQGVASVLVTDRVTFR
uniref:Uncharacterized protein n=1 Tax=Tetradesmus obliquus TaxID=3088 RepID=A0A383VMH0_TETOB|eukprot:jgi/Sobl393_1/2672/SZX66727.1